MRRRFKSSTDQPFGIQTGSKRRYSDQPSDITKTKQVRFAEAKMDGPPQHASPRRHEASHSPKSESPKTSEYAYFRNLRNKSIDGHSSAVHKEKKLSKSAKTNSSIKETNDTPDKLKKDTKYGKLLASEERAGAPNLHVFPSPRVKKYDEPYKLRNEDQVNHAKQTLLSLSENVTPVQEHSPILPLNEEFEISGQQCREKRVFSSKRQRLHQWVSQASFSEAKKLHPNGSDLVASLLARLFPYGDKYHDSLAGHDDNHESISKSPPTLEKEHQLPRISAWDEYLTKDYSCNSREIALQKQWHTLVADCPSPDRARDEMMYLDLGPKSRKSRNYRTEHEPSCLPRERYESSGEFSFPVQHTRKEEPHRLLLKWDLENDKDRFYLPVTEHDDEENICPSSWKVDNHMLCLTSSQPMSNAEFESIEPYQSSTSYLAQDFGPYLKYQVADCRTNFEQLKYEVADQFSLSPLSTCSKPFDLGDDQNALHSIMPYQSQSRLNDQVWNSKRHSDFLLEASPQKEIDLYSFRRLEEASGEPGTCLSKGAFNNLFDRLKYQPFSHYDASKYMSAEDEFQLLL